VDASQESDKGGEPMRKPENSKRGLFQFHLSTVILLTLVASVVIALNCHPTERVQTIGSGSKQVTLEQALVYDKVERQFRKGLYCSRRLDYGWPQPFCTYSAVVLPDANGWREDDAYGSPVGLEWASWHPDGDKRFGKRNLVIDIGFGLAVVLCVGIASEVILRRYGARRI
jgi:hypothetical protein